MKPNTYFRISLIVPIALPIVAGVFGVNQFTAIMVFSLLFSGIPYLVFAGVLFVSIGSLRGARSIRRLSFVAPLLFVPVNALFWLVPISVAGAFGSTPGAGWGTLGVFSLYVLVLGYLYVGVVNLGFFGLNRLRLVDDRSREGSPHQEG